MSYSKRERGQFIRLRMHYYILIDLGKGKINAIEAMIPYDLISFMSVAGTTYSKALANNEYYKRAVSDWVNCCRIKRERLLKSRSL